MTNLIDVIKNALNENVDQPFSASTGQLKNSRKLFVVDELKLRIDTWI
jgi:hypothetical protein